MISNGLKFYSDCSCISVCGVYKKLRCLYNTALVPRFIFRLVADCGKLQLHLLQVLVQSVVVPLMPEMEPRISDIQPSSTLHPPGSTEGNSILGSGLEQVPTSSVFVFFQYYCLRTGSDHEYFIVSWMFPEGRAV